VGALAVKAVAVVAVIGFASVTTVGKTAALSARRAHAPRGPCDHRADSVLLVEQAAKPLAFGKSIARFSLVLRGGSLATSAVDFCVVVNSELAYRHVWSARDWAEGYVRDLEANGGSIQHYADTVVVRSAKHFFDDWAFEWNPEDEDAFGNPWDNSFHNAYAGVGYSIKQYAYRTARQLPLALSLPRFPEDSLVPDVALPQSVRDSLNMAPVDSAMIRGVATRIRSEGAMIFHYTVCQGCKVTIVWDRLSRRFLLVFVR